MSDSGHMAMATRNRSLPSPAGTTRPMRASGTNTPSRTVSWLCVGRMPSVSQVSTTVDAGAGALDEGVHDLRPAGRVGVDGVGAEPGPGRAVGAELLAAGEAVAALDPLGQARRQQHGMSLPASAWPAAKTSPSTAASRIQRSDVSPARSSSVAMPIQ